MFQMISKRMGVIVIGAALLPMVACGCRNDRHKQQRDETAWRQRHQDKPASDKFFIPDGHPRAVNEFIDQMAASGATEDATLNSGDFTGHGLNTAGRAKLDLMMKHHGSDRPMVVYLNLAPKDPAASPRRDSVKHHVDNSGMHIASLELKDGANPATLHPAAPALAQLRKTDSDNRSSGGYGSSANGAMGVTQGSQGVAK
jgi:hypothetical protein